MGNMLLYVMEPDTASVDFAKTKISNNLSPAFSR